MPFLALGVEHKTAPLAIRERVALEAEEAGGAGSDLLSHPTVTEAAVLSTCNRTEVYLFVEDLVVGSEHARAWLIRRDPEIDRYIQIWPEMEAVEHLFRVASGLESQVLGEPQILGQVREALDIGQHQGSIGPNLHSLFRSAINCARHARAGTLLGRLNPSLASEAVRTAQVRGKSILLIGGGEISRLVAAAVREEGPREVFVANRTGSVAAELAESIGGSPALLDDIPRLLPRVDVIVSATSAPRYILTPDDFEGVVRSAPLLIYDLAIPRDVDPDVGTIPQVELHDLDSLLPPGYDSHWDQDIRSMESVIAGEVHEFSAWYLTRRVAPVIASLRSHVEAVQAQELKRIAPHLESMTERERAAVESLTSRLIDKMFHHLVVRLRLAAQTDPKLVEAAEFFFLHGEGGLFPHAAEDSVETSEIQS